MRRPLMFVPIAIVLLALAPSALAQHSTAMLTVLFTVVDGIIIDCPDEARTPYMACGVSTTTPNNIRLVVNSLLSPDIGYVPFTEWKHEDGSWQRAYLARDNHRRRRRRPLRRNRLRKRVITTPL